MSNFDSKSDYPLKTYPGVGFLSIQRQRVKKNKKLSYFKTGKNTLNKFVAALLHESERDIRLFGGGVLFFFLLFFYYNEN